MRAIMAKNLPLEPFSSRHTTLLCVRTLLLYCCSPSPPPPPPPPRFRMRFRRSRRAHRPRNTVGAAKRCIPCLGGCERAPHAAPRSLAAPHVCSLLPLIAGSLGLARLGGRSLVCLPAKPTLQPH